MCNGWKNLEVRDKRSLDFQGWCTKDNSDEGPEEESFRASLNLLRVSVVTAKMLVETENKGYSNKVSGGNGEEGIRNGGKYHLCYTVVMTLVESCPSPRSLWNTELKIDELGNLAEEPKQQSIQATAWIPLTTSSEMWEQK